MQQKRRDVFAVHLARVIGHGRWQIGRPKNGHALLQDDAIGLRELAVAAAFGGQIDNH